MSKKIVYAYRMTSDTGYAPCVFEDGYKQSKLLSLACCKGGQLRHKKGSAEEITEVNTGLRYTLGKNYMEQVKNGEVELYVIGILKDRIIWCAQITKIITMKDYYSDDEKKYGERLDFIYTVKQPETENAKTGNLIRNERHTLFHGLELTDQHKRDELGKYVLLSENYVYFGKNSESIPSSLKEKLPQRQESKCYSESDEDIIAYVSKLMDKRTKSPNPTIILSEKNCKGCQQK